MGGNFTKVRSKEKAKRKSLLVDFSNEIQNYKPRTKNHTFGETFSDLTRAESDMSEFSPSTRNNFVTKPSCAKINSPLIGQMNALGRSNNSSPSFSSNTATMTLKTNGSRLFDGTLENLGNIRPTNVRNINLTPKENGKSDSKENLLKKSSSIYAENNEDKTRSSQSNLANTGENIFSGDAIRKQPNIRKKFSNESLNGGLLNAQPKAALGTSTVSSISPKHLVPTDCLQNLSTGDIDVPTNIHPAIAKRNRNSDAQFLAEKPPTPPPKSQTTVATTNSGSVNKTPAKRHSEPVSRYLTPRRTLSPPLMVKHPTPRTSSLPRAVNQDRWFSLPRESSRSLSPVGRGRNTSIPLQSEVEPPTERPAWLSRIEYTFYINDTEEYQRPFHDRRIEAVARTSQCNICLHKPSTGYRPVYYKGIRVLPVTISARTMVALKRCIARLDIQYPYYNVKAFCPPDMY